MAEDPYGLLALFSVNTQHLYYTLITCFLRNNLVGLRQNTYKHTNPKKRDQINTQKLTKEDKEFNQRSTQKLTKEDKELNREISSDDEDLVKNS
ncbi:hypothetical protein AGMMS49936_08020 [Endomicrobiia bacterium]|nr:hypothetical protein AGMMS49936_08020 [Endomicrobiia bacterium]